MRYRTKPTSTRYFDTFHDPKNDVFHIRETDQYGKHISDDVQAVPGKDFLAAHEPMVRAPQKPRDKKATDTVVNVTPPPGTTLTDTKTPGGRTLVGASGR